MKKTSGVFGAMALAIVLTPPATAFEVIDNILALNIELSFAPSAAFSSDNDISIDGSGRALVGSTLSFLSLGLPLSVNAAGLMTARGRTIEWHIRELNAALFGALFFSVGKQDIAWGYGDFYQPTFFISSQSTLDLTTRERSFYQWAINARYDTGLYAGDFYAIVDDSIEEVAPPRWVAAAAHNQFHLGHTELFATAGYYYLRETRFTSIDQHQLHLGVETEVFIFDVLGVDARPLPGDWLKIIAALNNQITFADAVRYDPQFVTNVTLSDVTATPFGYNLVAEFVYNSTWSVGLFGSISYEQIEISTIVTIALESSDYAMSAAVAHTPNKHLNHSITLSYNSANSFFPWSTGYTIKGAL